MTPGGPDDNSPGDKSLHSRRSKMTYSTVQPQSSSNLKKNKKHQSPVEYSSKLAVPERPHTPDEDASDDLVSGLEKTPSEQAEIRASARNNMKQKDSTGMRRESERMSWGNDKHMPTGRFGSVIQSDFPSKLINPMDSHIEDFKLRAVDNTGGDDSNNRLQNKSQPDDTSAMDNKSVKSVNEDIKRFL